MSLRLLAAFLLLPVSLRAEAPLAAGVETTLATDGEHLRQLAFDGDKESFFASEKNAEATDLFTLRLEKPVTIRAVQVFTGRPDGRHKLEAGTLEISADGKAFEQLATFRNGVAEGKPKDKKIQAIRIKPSSDLKYSLIVREIVFDAEPTVAVFKSLFPKPLSPCTQGRGVGVRGQKPVKNRPSPPAPLP